MLSSSFVVWSLTRWFPNIKNFFHILRNVTQMTIPVEVQFSSHLLPIPSFLHHTSLTGVTVHQSLNYMILYWFLKKGGQSMACIQMGPYKQQWKIVYHKLMSDANFLAVFHPTKPFIGIVEDSQCLVLNVKSAAAIKRLDCEMYVNYMCFHDCLPLLAVCMGERSGGGLVCVWDTRTWQLQHRISVADNAMRASFHPTKNLLAILSHDSGTIACWTPEQGLYQSIETHDLPNELYMFDTFVLVEIDYGELHLYDTKTSKCTDKLATPNMMVTMHRAQKGVLVETYDQTPGNSNFCACYVYPNEKGKIETQTVTSTPLSSLTTALCVHLGCWITINVEGDVVIKRMTQNSNKRY